MKQFNYYRPSTLQEAYEAAKSVPDAKYLAGGTNLLDLMKLQIETPGNLIDVNGLGLDQIEETADGGLRIGALVRNTALASHPTVRAHYGVVSRAILAGASGQLRNRATSAGNLLQRTRCPYFYDSNAPCNKRAPGSGCAALEGLNHNHAILGASDKCIATHPSDMAVALRALDATVEVVSTDGIERKIPIADFHRLPGDAPHIETALNPGDFITGVRLPAPVGGQHFYWKARERASYAFANVSVALVIDRVDGVDQIKRLSFGGLAHKPWRVEAAELTAMSGASSDEVVEEALSGAAPTDHNAYKIPLAHRLVAGCMHRTRGAAA